MGRLLVRRSYLAGIRITRATMRTIRRKGKVYLEFCRMAAVGSYRRSIGRRRKERRFRMLFDNPKDLTSRSTFSISSSSSGCNSIAVFAQHDFLYHFPSTTQLPSDSANAGLHLFQYRSQFLNLVFNTFLPAVLAT